MNTNLESRPEVSESCPYASRVLDALVDDQSASGPTLSYSLAFHVAECASCGELARRVGSVTATMTELRGQPSRSSLLGRANVHALRMLRRSVRASVQAQRLARATPGVELYARLRDCGIRFGLSAMTAALVFTCRVGVRAGYQRGSELTQILADYHTEHHIYGDSDEWLT
jgi:hypothetical protein